MGVTRQTFILLRIRILFDWTYSLLNILVGNYVIIEIFGILRGLKPPDGNQFWWEGFLGGMGGVGWAGGMGGEFLLVGGD